MQQKRYEKSNSGSCLGIWFVLFLVPSSFAVFLALGYAEVVPFKVNMHTLITIVVIFIIYLFFIKHNAAYSACKVNNNFSDTERNLKEALEATSLSILGDTKSTLNIRDYLSDYFAGIRDNNYAKVASSVFPMLGILGTFIAIAVSMPDFSASSSENLDREISLLLSGIGTAFYASIYGIFLSLWWTFFERMGLARIERSSQKLESIYGDKIWSKSELLRHEHMQADLKDKRLIDALRETFSVEFVKDMSVQHMRSYSNIMDETSKQFNTVANRLLEASASLQDTAGHIYDKREILAGGEKLSRDVDKFISGVESLNRGLGHLDNSIDRTFEKIDNELASAVGKLGEMTKLIAAEKYREV